MKVYDLTWQVFWASLRHGWKRILLFVLFFAMLGMFAGFKLSRKGDLVGVGSADQLRMVTYDDIENDDKYEYNCIVRILMTCDDTQWYIMCLKEDITVSPSQEDQLMQVQERLRAYYDSELASAAKRVVQSDGAINEFSEEGYAKTSQKLKQLRDEMNLLIGDVNVLGTQIAEENHIGIHLIYNEGACNTYNPGWAFQEEQEETPLTIGISHSFGISYAHDAFLCATLFCMLVGLCAGIYDAVAHEARGKTEE